MHVEDTILHVNLEDQTQSYLMHNIHKQLSLHNRLHPDSQITEIRFLLAKTLYGIPVTHQISPTTLLTLSDNPTEVYRLVDTPINPPLKPAVTPTHAEIREALDKL